MTFGQIGAIIFAAAMFLLMCAGGIVARLVKDDLENPGRLWHQGDEE